MCAEHTQQQTQQQTQHTNAATPLDSPNADTAHKRSHATRLPQCSSIQGILGKYI